MRENGVDEIIANTSHNRIKNSEKLAEDFIKIKDDMINGATVSKTPIIIKLNYIIDGIWRVFFFGISKSAAITPNNRVRIIFF